MIILLWARSRQGSFRLHTRISEPPSKNLQGTHPSKLEIQGSQSTEVSHSQQSLRYSHIIWDWNGTLLDDLQLCLRIINSLLSERQLPAVSKEKYLEVFGFPVRDYYQKLGFDFSLEPFEDISTEFIQAYEAGRPDCPLMAGAAETLRGISEAGITQSILSASKQDYLIKAVDDYGINGIFSAIHGLDDHHASGKLDIATAFMAESNLEPSRTLFIGDTLHDAEIARTIQVDCWLIPNGHQSRQRLARLDLPLVESLPKVTELVISTWL
jgi:phosphoglycolate phosphatase